MPRLILVKHSLPRIDPAVPSPLWNLSEAGRTRCAGLARHLAAYQPEVIVSSTEPKAVETAELAAALLGLESQAAEGLQENDRTGVPFLPREQLEAGIAAFFDRPAERVFGAESADQAWARFDRAVRDQTERHPGRNVVVVAHGVVITLLVSRAAGEEPFALWRQLGLPSFLVLSLPERALVGAEYEIGG